MTHRQDEPRLQVPARDVPIPAHLSPEARAQLAQGTMSNPAWLQSGTRDLFLSNTVLMHRALPRAEIEAELHIFDAATHVMFMAGPESADRTRELRRFVDRHWRRSPPPGPARSGASP